MLSIRTILVICFIQMSFTLSMAQAQIDSTKFRVGIRVGPAIPLGNFSTPGKVNTPLASDTIYGFAKTGFHFNVIGSWNFSKSASFVISVHGNINSFNTNAYNSCIVYYEPTATLTSANNFYTGEYLGGLSIDLPVKKVTIHIIMLGGLLTSNYPNVTTNFSATSSQPAGTFTWSAKGYNNLDSHFALGAGYRLSKHISIDMDLGVSYASVTYPSYSYSETFQGGPTISVTEKLNAYFNLILVSVNGGVSYCF